MPENNRVNLRLILATAELTDEEARKVLFGQTAESIVAAAKGRK